jgi:translation initiation factor IF-2
MAKKRVHEIAKSAGLTSKEVLAALKAAGIEAKAAASSVEEAEAKAAIAAAAGDGGAAKKPAAKKPAAKKSAPKAKAEPKAKAATRAEAKAAPKATAEPKAAPAAKSESKAARAAKAEAAKPTPAAKAEAGLGAAAATAEKPKAEAPAKPAPAAAGSEPAAKAPAKPPGSGAAPSKRRRVVIDSQAARREQMGAPPPQRPPRRRGGRRRRPLLEEPVARTEPPPEPDAIRVNSGATVREVAELLGLGSAEVIKELMMSGEMATLTQTLPDETIRSIAQKFERKIEIVTAADEEPEEPEFEDADEDLLDRPPVVTIMGHVDHGKTSLLDAIRETEVAAGEAGGITQHIGAYQVHHDGKTITFLDTPGHAAFTAMRARGAQVTDVAVIVVAADDGVMPQTKEAIDHARAADVPILIAVNKIDVEGAQPDRVRTELASDGLNPEEWGGETVYVDVSAKTHDGLDRLLEMIVLVSDLEELGANPDAPASGTVIESQLDQGRGPVVSVLVQRGTLNVGDSLVAGPQWGRVRAMHDFTGDRIDTAGPGMPVEVLGFDGVVEAGEFVQAVDNDRRAREMAQERGHRLKTESLARRQARTLTLEEVFARAQEGEIKDLNIVLKSDVAGSLGALQDEIAKVPQEQVAINVIHAQTGGINESDVMLAAASQAIIIGFNVRPLSDARKAAATEGVDIRTYSVIYKVTEDLRAAMEGMLEAVEVEETLGEAEIKQTFKASKVGRIAGCIVTDGKVQRDAQVRLIRDGTVIWTGRLGSLRRFKDNVQEVEEGQECGIVLEGYADVKEGDILEFFKTKQVEQTLDT